MTPEEFVEKWRGSTRTEKSASHEHFLDLCELLEVSKPQERDRHGEWYTFEKRLKKPDGSAGFADVWLRGHFGWEYKGPNKSLVKAYSQLKEYADALENPPLLIVSDMQEIRVHTNFTNSVSVQHVVALGDLIGVEARRLLRRCFTEPEKLRPTITREGVTKQAAKAFGEIALKLRARKFDARRVAHFLNRLVFCLFVEDIDLLPDRVFREVVEESIQNPDKFQPALAALFRAMKDDGGMFGTVSVPWFNGGLFDDDDVLPLGWLDIRDIAAATRLDWSAIDPSIFGTLFEAGLDPEKREIMASLFDPPAPKGKQPSLQITDAGVGIHYTDPATIMKIIEPVVLRPLREEWERVRLEIERRLTEKQTEAAATIWLAFRDALGSFRILDPACGSGNFLYLALHHLKNFDLQTLMEGRQMALPEDALRVSVAAVRGIEKNAYAAELARVTIWIGELQWQIRNALNIQRAPILERLDNIEHRDALLNDDATEAAWPHADVVIGNPPFLGGKKLRSMLRDQYVDRLFSAYEDRVPAEADLVAYWFVKAWELVRAGELQRVGLVATNSIRGHANRRVIRPIAEAGAIFEAWDDEPWVVDGAAVRVSLICFGNKLDDHARLDGQEVEEIHADLTASDADLTKARPLSENADIAFMGDTKGGAFDIPGDLARKWLLLPLNPNDRPNADVLRPWFNGMDITRRPADKWIVDFGWTMDEEEAALYEVPFAHVHKHVRPERRKNRRESYKIYWWRHVEPRQGMWTAIGSAPRFIVTPTIAKHRLFAWLPSSACPDHQLIVIARSDDTTFGILHSRFHEIWALRQGTSLEDRPRYTPRSTFETFPFPEGLQPNFKASSYARDPRAKAIAAAAKKLDQLRSKWLNPPDLVKTEPEVVAGFPDRLRPGSLRGAEELQRRTLTNLYNERPIWLQNAHHELDAAVAAAYRWPQDISSDDALQRLLELNLQRSAEKVDI